MKQFAFKLEPILTYRKSVEDGAASRLRGIQEAIQQTENSREALEKRIASYGHSMEELGRGVIDIHEIRRLAAYLNQLRAEMARLLQELSKLEQARIGQLGNLLEARKEREIVEKLKEGRLNDHKKAAQSLEQKMLDEISVTQFGRTEEQKAPAAPPPTRHD